MQSNNKNQESKKTMTKNYKLPSTAKVIVTTNLFNAGQDEFGTNYDAEVYQVQIRFENGQTLNHGHGFYSTEAVQTPDGFDCFPDYREEKKAAANKLADRVRSAGQIDLTLWDEGEPVYGSPAYLGAVELMTPEQLAQ
tara:strand:+ start:72 stop:485 length:414 start_codon:yes stop_codon:yes gene_type:complete